MDRDDTDDQFTLLSGTFHPKVPDETPPQENPPSEKELEAAGQQRLF